MGQDVFDGGVLAGAAAWCDSFAKSGNDGDADAGMKGILAGAVEAYADLYTGDNLFVPQLLDAIPRILALAPVRRDPRKWKETFMQLTQERSKFDSEMRSRSWLGRVFGGTVTQRSHPNPLARVDTCEKNVRQLACALQINWS